MTNMPRRGLPDCSRCTRLTSQHESVEPGSLIVVGTARYRHLEMTGHRLYALAPERARGQVCHASDL